MKITRKISNTIAVIIFCFGIFFFIKNLLISNNILDYDKEISLYDIQNIIELDNKVYIGLGFYNRIQIYDIKGNYLKYYKTNNYSKAFDFNFDEFGQLNINLVFVKKHKQYIFKQKNGVNYEINYLPIQIRRNDNNNKNDFIINSFFNSISLGPNRPWFISLLGLILLLSLNLKVIQKVANH